MTYPVERGEVASVVAESEPVMSQRESWKSFGIRAFKTFIQGATGALLAGGLLEDLNVSVFQSAAVGGYAALVSFAHNWSSAAEQPKATTAK